MRDKKLMLLIGLGILAVLSFLYGVLTPSKLRRGTVSAVDTNPKEALANAATSFPAERQTRSSTHAAWGRNPFLPKGMSTTQASRQLTLNGIAWDENFPRAVINNRIVRVGDQIGGNKVVKIERNLVVLNDGVSRFELRLGRKK